MNLTETETEVVLEPAPRAEAAVIWLHGLGADGHDFVPIVQELGLPEDPAIRFIFPHAPVRAVSINNGMQMRAWYDITPDMRRQDAAGIAESAKTVQGYIDAQVAAGIAADHIVLAGFSQGGAITLHTGLRQKEKLAGLLALSTYVPLPEAFAKEANPARRDTPILMCHGTADPMLPHQLGTWSRDLLQQAGFEVTWKEYPMQHQVCLEEIQDISAWLREKLKPKSRLLLPPHLTR